MINNELLDQIKHDPGKQKEILDTYLLIGIKVYPEAVEALEKVRDRELKRLNIEPYC